MLHDLSHAPVDDTWPRMLVHTRQEGRVNARGLPLSPSAYTASTAVHSREKVVGYFLGEIPPRKNLKEWIYLFGKKGHFS
jgi:hypothetical protein